MKRLYIPLILFLLLILEGVALDFLPQIMLDTFSVIPHWVFTFLIFIAIFYDKKGFPFSVLYSVIFGLLIDIVYTGVLGVYMFSYVIIMYIVYELKEYLYENLFVTLLISTVSIALVDFSINGIYTIIGIRNVEWMEYFLYRLTPTVLANLVFLLILYPILSKRLKLWGDEQSSGIKSLLNR